MRIDTFLAILQQFYVDFGRHDMLWRQPEADNSFSPYKILVSELMLQQTQVSRVTPKYAAFLENFPDVRALADAGLGDVLRLWSGLGYNRRAKFLRQAAQMVERDFGGQFPRTHANIIQLPGVGPNTAGAIMAYAYDEPVVYVETNIRTVMIRHFFEDQATVTDAAIRGVLVDIIAALASPGSPLSPRDFYWAMMDYGAFLKKSVGNLNRVSTSYARQSTFHGSRRQIRGMVIRLLTERPYDRTELLAQIADDRTVSVIGDLVLECLVKESGDQLWLA